MRFVLLGIWACLPMCVATPAQALQVPWPTDGWSVSTAAEQGLNDTPLVALHEGIKAGTYGFIDRLLVVKNGYLIVNQRYDQDYVEASRGASGPLGCGIDACRDPSDVHPYNYLHPDVHPYPGGVDVHSLQSVTKSVTATLVAIAIERGEISGVEVPLLSFFRSYDLTGIDPQLRETTLEDLLTMRSGIEWHEQDRPLDESNTTLQLERSEDWIQFTLDQPMDSEPGVKWAYNSGGSHLMSGVIEDATGDFVDAYAEAHLFGPLGIDVYHWKKTPTGYPDTEGGLYLEAEDLAKVGYLYLQDGVWDGKRILPEGWARNATAIHVKRVNQVGWGYGYQWWRVDQGGTEIWAGLGFGGQFLLIMPEFDMVGVVNSWNLFQRPPAAILGALATAMIEAAG